MHRGALSKYSCANERFVCNSIGVDLPLLSLKRRKIAEEGDSRIISRPHFEFRDWKNHSVKKHRFARSLLCACMCEQLMIELTYRLLPPIFTIYVRKTAYLTVLLKLKTKSQYQNLIAHLARSNPKGRARRRGPSFWRE